MTAFSLEVSYAQVAVFDATLASPFNDWTTTHVAQGFSWRPGSVSFATLDAAGVLAARVERTTPNAVGSLASRVISVPFTVPSHCSVEVATITESVRLELRPGEYEITFEHGRADSGDR